MDYISNPDRQEHLYAVFDTTVDERFWDYLAGENHKAFKQSGAQGECIEARELIIMLPPSLREYDPDALLKLFVMKFKIEYGLDCHAGLHHNKAETNYHIHLIYSERKPLEKPDVKIASRNMFYDETGKHRRTKKERLQAIMVAIRKIDSKIEHKQELQKKYRGPQYQKFKVKLIKELGELLLQRRAKQDRLTEIVREAGYKDVSKFSKAFEKSCKLLEEYQAQAATMKKESVVKKLRANVEEAKLKPHAEKTLGMEEELKKKKDDDPR